MRPLPLAMIACAALLAACSRTESMPEPVRDVRTLVVVAESAGGVAEYAGEVRPRTESRLGFRVGGKVVSRQAELGQAVKAGQVLAQLDAQDLKLAQEGARAAFAAAKANHDQAQADFGRFKELLDMGFISAAELDRRVTALKPAQAQLEQARTQAAADGVVTGIEAEPGMVVAPGTPVLRLAHDGPRDVVFAVPEDKITLIKGLSEQGGAFHVKLWGSDGEPLPATIREIAAAADPVTRTFTVKADIGLARAVRLGQSATLLAALPRTEGVAKLPLSALREDQGPSTVWLVDRDNMTVNTRAVQCSASTATRWSSVQASHRATRS